MDHNCAVSLTYLTWVSALRSSPKRSATSLTILAPWFHVRILKHIFHVIHTSRFIFSEKFITIQYEKWGSRGSTDVDVGPLGCNAVWTCEKIPTFRRNKLPPFPAWRWEPYVLLKRYIQVHTALQPRTSTILIIWSTRYKHHIEQNTSHRNSITDLIKGILYSDIFLVIIVN